MLPDFFVVFFAVGLIHGFLVQARHDIERVKAVVVRVFVRIMRRHILAVCCTKCLPEVFREPDGIDCEPETLVQLFVLSRKPFLEFGERLWLLCWGR